MSTVRADNFGNRAGTSSVTADTLLQGTAKAWLNLNGTGTIAARDSFNISSLIDNAVGSYSPNLSVAMPNNNYAVISSCYPVITNYEFISCGTNLQSRFDLFVTSVSGAGVPSRQDNSSVYAALMGDPA